jgi:hypothetical protein
MGKGLRQPGRFESSALHGLESPFEISSRAPYGHLGYWEMVYMLENSKMHLCVVDNHIA